MMSMGKRWKRASNHKGGAGHPFAFKGKPYTLTLHPAYSLREKTTSQKHKKAEKKIKNPVFPAMTFTMPRLCPAASDA